MSATGSASEECNLKLLFHILKTETFGPRFKISALAKPVTHVELDDVLTITHLTVRKSPKRI